MKKTTAKENPTRPYLPHPILLTTTTAAPTDYLPPRKSLPPSFPREEGRRRVCDFGDFVMVYFGDSSTFLPSLC